MKNFTEIFFFILILEYTNKTNRSWSKQWPGSKFETIFCRAHHRRTHISRKSICSLETNVSCSEAPCRYVASPQKMKKNIENVSDDDVEMKICTDLKYNWRTVELHKYNLYGILILFLVLNHLFFRRDIILLNFYFYL